MRTNIHFEVLIALWRCIVMYMIMLYTSNYYEDKYFITLFAHFKHKGKINNKSLKWIFWGSIFKLFLGFQTHFLREQFEEHLCFKIYFFFERAILKCIFWRALMFWNVFFEGAILKNIYLSKCIFWGSNLWLLISVTAALYFYGCWIVWLLIFWQSYSIQRI